MTMSIKREVVATGTNLEELRQAMKDKAAALNMGDSRSNNDHGPVYTTTQYDLRIERDTGEADSFRIMLLHKQASPPGFRERFKLRKG